MTYEKMSSVAERLRCLQLDEEEAQRLQLQRRNEERRRRRSSSRSAPVVVRIPSGAEATPVPPLTRQDTVPPPPPPDEVMQEALAPQAAPFAPPAQAPSPLTAGRPALHSSLQRSASEEGVFQGSKLAAFELRSQARPFKKRRKRGR